MAHHLQCLRSPVRFFSLKQKKQIGEAGNLVICGEGMSGGLRVSTSWRMYGPLDDYGSGKALLPVRYAPFSAGSQVILPPKSPTRFGSRKMLRIREVASVGFRNSEGDTPRKEL